MTLVDLIFVWRISLKVAADHWINETPCSLVVLNFKEYKFNYDHRKIPINFDWDWLIGSEDSRYTTNCCLRDYSINCEIKVKVLHRRGACKYAIGVIYTKFDSEMKPRDHDNNSLDGNEGEIMSS